MAYGLKMVLCEYQNHYPDITFIAPDKSKIALDLKSTYIIDEQAVNGFTLGAFTGYFRDRQSRKNITFPYEEYKAHFVLGVIYNRNDALSKVYYRNLQEYLKWRAGMKTRKIKR